MGDNTRRDRRTKVLSMTVRYRSATLGEFIEHHSYDVSRGGMFIKTPSPFPPGTLLKFEVKIADEQRVMQGVGRVVWKRDQEGSQPGEPMGMGIKFIKIDEASRTVIDRLVEERGGDTKGAYDRSPDVPGRMFPEGPAVLPEPEDRTVMKSANQLLRDALEKTGETPEHAAASERSMDKASSLTPVPPSPALEPSSRDEVVAAGAEVSASERNLRESAPTTQKIEAEVRKSSALRASRPRTNAGAGASRPRTQPGGIPSRPRTNPALEDEEGSGGRALLTILAAVAVAGGIYIVTKPDPGPPPVEQGNAASPSAAIPSPPVEGPGAPEPEAEQNAEAALPGVIEDPADVAAPSTAASTPEPIPEPPARPRLPEKPAPRPAPVPKPAPPPAPVPKPAPPPQPVPKPAPEPSPAPAVAPTVAPSSAPARSPAALPQSPAGPAPNPETPSAPADTAVPQ